jgi:hypothetical protein
MKIPIIIITFLFIGALFIISTQNIHIGISQERGVFVHAYTGWITGLVNHAIEITGDVVKVDWLPG